MVNNGYKRLKQYSKDLTQTLEYPSEQTRTYPEQPAKTGIKQPKNAQKLHKTAVSNFFDTAVSFETVPQKARRPRYQESWIPRSLSWTAQRTP